MRKPARPVAPAPLKGFQPGGPVRGLGPGPAPSPAGHHQAKPRQTAAQARQAHQRRVAAARKAAATRKKNAAKAGKRQLALGEEVACCAAEALAASLRLAGWPVTDADVLALYELTAGDEDEGATIEATLEAAAEHGLAGARPSFRPGPGGVSAQGCDACWPPGLGDLASSVILGVDLPGPHALCDDGTAWWSWGQPFAPASFPDAVIEEAWLVRWETA